MHEPRQLGQRGDDVRRFGQEPPLERGEADPVVHPALEVRQRGHPQVELRVEVAAEALDVEQRLLQQHELRLDLDVEAARRAEELQQHAAERDLGQRPVEGGLEHDADLGLELVDAGVRRHPAGFDVRGRDAVVVAAEEREEVLRQEVLVALGQRAHDPEIDGDVLAVVRRRGGDEDVARMHVRVEVAVAEDLREEELDAGAREPGNVHARLAQPLHLRDRDARHPLHHHHVGAAVVPVHLGDEQQRRALEVAPQLRAVRGLAREVELVAQGLLELAHHFARPQPLAVRPELLHEQRAGVQQRDVLLDHLRDVGPQHLDRDRRSVGQLGEVHLRHRRARDRRPVERPEHGVHRLPVQPREFREHLFRRERRHAVLQLGELVGDVLRQQVAPGRQHLPELDEDRPEVLEREAQPLRERRRRVAPESEGARRRPHGPEALVAGQELVEAVLERDDDDLREASDAHPVDCKGNDAGGPVPCGPSTGNQAQSLLWGR